MPVDSPGFDITGAMRFPGVLYGLALLFLAYFAARARTRTLQRFGERFTDRRLLFNRIATVSRFVLWLSVLVAATTLSVRLSKEVVLALTGTAAVTIGFALKDLAASMIAGLIIMFDRPFQVGDRVTFGGSYGEVAAIGLRSVRLVTLDDNVVTIPNNKFLTEIAASGNWGALDMLIQLDFFIGADQDVGSAKRVVEDAITSSRYAFVKKPWTVLVNHTFDGGCAAIRLRAKVYVLDVKYETELQTDVSERVIDGFRRLGIRPPAILHRALSERSFGAPLSAASGPTGA